MTDLSKNVANFHLKTSSDYCSYLGRDRRETALQDAIVSAKSGRLELGDNNLQTL